MFSFKTRHLMKCRVYTWRLQRRLQKCLMLLLADVEKQYCERTMHGGLGLMVMELKTRFLIHGKYLLRDYNKCLMNMDSKEIKETQ